MAFPSPTSPSTAADIVAGNSKSTMINLKCFALLDSSIQNSNLLTRRMKNYSQQQRHQQGVAALRIDFFHTGGGPSPSGNPAEPLQDPFHTRVRVGGVGPQTPGVTTNSATSASDSPNFATLYDVLGVAETATVCEIKRAFRQLARRFHPDAAAGNKKSLNEASAARFVEIRAAYSTLSDPDTRARYDNDRLRRFSATTAPPYYYGAQHATMASSTAATATTPFGYCSPRTPYSTRGRSWETDQCWC